MGVTKLADRRYRARYSLNGKRFNVGTFKTAKEAHAALGAHYWDNPELMRGYQEHTGPDKKQPQTKRKNRLKTLWQNLKKNLEKRNLL